ncbi:hypothetical protein GCM10009131_07870 [Morganella psychrotolerans]
MTGKISQKIKKARIDILVLKDANENDFHCVILNKKIKTNIDISLYFYRGIKIKGNYLLLTMKL